MTDDQKRAARAAYERDIDDTVNLPARRVWIVENAGIFPVRDLPLEIALDLAAQFDGQLSVDLVGVRT